MQHTSISDMQLRDIKQVHLIDVGFYGYKHPDTFEVPVLARIEEGDHVKVSQLVGHLDSDNPHAERYWCKVRLVTTAHFEPVGHTALICEVANHPMFDTDLQMHDLIIVRPHNVYAIDKATNPND